MHGADSLAILCTCYRVTSAILSTSCFQVTQQTVTSDPEFTGVFQKSGRCPHDLKITELVPHGSWNGLRGAWSAKSWTWPSWTLFTTTVGWKWVKLAFAEATMEENFTSDYPEEEFPSSPFIGEIVWKYVIVQFFLGGQKQKLWIWMHLAGQMDCHLLHADVARLWGQGFRSQTSWWRHRTPCQSKTFDARFCVSCPFPKSVKVISQKGIDINIRDKYTLQIRI